MTVNPKIAKGATAKGRGGKGRRRNLKELARKVCYLDPAEARELEIASKVRRISVSQFLAEAGLKEARRVNLETAKKRG